MTAYHRLDPVPAPTGNRAHVRHPRPRAEGQAAHPLLLRHLTVKDWPGLFGAVGKAIAGAAKLDFKAAIDEGLKALSYVAFKDRPAELAWVWIQRSLALAAPSVAAAGNRPIVFSARDTEPIDAALARLDIVLDQDFFDHPTWNPYVRTVGGHLRALFATTFGDEVADVALARFYLDFAVILEAEWKRNESLLQAVIPRERPTPVSTAVDEEAAWAAYSEWLLTQADRPVFEEAFGVRTVYVPLRAYADRDDGVAITRTVGMADEMLDHWLAAGRADDAVRVLAGDPGAGKSTLARIYSADRFGRTTGERRWRVVFAPLHHREFEAERPLTEAVAAYTREVARGLAKPLDRDAPDPTLLVLDGLDELSRAGRVGLEQMRAFITAVGVLLESWNTDPKAARLMVLVCGRPIAADVARAAVRRPEAMLHLLPFVIDEQEIKTPPAGRKLTLDWQFALPVADQREAWWGQYADAKGGEAWAGVYAEIKKNESLTAVTGQPLLNYLVAFLRENTPDRTLPTGRFDLYRRLTHAVWLKRWGENRGPTAGLSKFEHFLDLLEEMAVAAWHGGNIREIRVTAVKSHLTPEQCKRLTEVESEVDHGLLRLMLAFFTRPRGGVKGDEAYEFTHKSFAEFLVASRVSSHLDALVEQYARPDSRPDRRDEDALIDWARLFGPAELDKDLRAFIEDAATTRGKEWVTAWGTVVARLLGVVVRGGMPMHKMTTDIKPEPTFRAMNEWALRAEFAMMSVLDACASVTRERWKVDGLSGALGTWVGSRWAEWGKTGSYSWLDLRRTCLKNLRLTQVSLYRASLAEADLTGADLTGADLNGVYLGEADLTRADLNGVYLGEANLYGTNLTRANLTGANLYESNLTGANLTWANLTWANLTGANLTGADLTGAHINSARLDSVVGVTVANLARLTHGDPKSLPNRTEPAPDWRTKALAPKRAPRRRKEAPTPQPPGPVADGTAPPPENAGGEPAGPATPTGS